MSKKVLFKIFKTQSNFNSTNPSRDGSVILIKDSKKLIIDGVEFNAEFDIPDVSSFITESALTQIKLDITQLKNKKDKYLNNVQITGGATKTLTFSFSDSSTLQTNFQDIDTVGIAYDDSAIRSRLTAVEQKNTSQDSEISNRETIANVNSKIQIAKSELSSTISSEKANAIQQAKAYTDTMLQWEEYD